MVHCKLPPLDPCFRALTDFVSFFNRLPSFSKSQRFRITYSLGIARIELHFRRDCFMSRLRTLVVFLVLAFIGSISYAQVFRGGLSGTVVDVQGAVIANAAVQLKDPATDTVRDGKSNGAGEFNFPEVVPGVYTLTVSAPGFETYKEDAINIEVSKVVNLKIPLTVGAASTVVDVQANGVQVDTTTSSIVSIVDTKSVQDMPMNGRNFTQMIQFNEGVVGSGYANGSSHINYQVDGVDNVDNAGTSVASNQGGIASLPGGLIPIEAIDQFSVQSNGESDMGRNAGANQNMVMKSGTNQIHGDAFYYVRNEFFAAITPVAPIGSRKAPIRNNQFGFTLGGPLWKDHTFLFLAGEIQLASAGNSTNVTAVNNDWLAVGKTIAQDFGYSSTQNPVTALMYKNLFPSVADTATVGAQYAQINNFFATAPDQYNSYNFMIKLDHHFGEKQTVSLRYIGTTGKQTAVYSGNYYPQYFQTAPMRIHNASAIWTQTFSPRVLNQVTFGMNYFLQTFNDADQNYYPQTNDGINVGGSTSGQIAAGAPSISISGFLGTGATQPQGRTDVTGQAVDQLRWSLGKHSLKLGGEYRYNYSYDFGGGSPRGSFSFNGTGGPWSTTSPLSAVTPQCIAADQTLAGAVTAAKVTKCDGQYCYALGQVSGNPQGADYTVTNSSPATPTGALANINCNSSVLAMADFFIGQTGYSTATSGGGTLTVGSPTRIYLLNQLDFWASDTWQASSKLSLQYGVRYSVPGVVHDEGNNSFSWIPQGTSGKFVEPYYNQYWKAFAPRVGFSYSPFSNNKTAIRGDWGLIYDTLGLLSLAPSTGNPAGPSPSYSATAPSFVFGCGSPCGSTGVDPFTSLVPASAFTASGISPNYRIPYSMNFAFGLEQRLAKATLLSVGYIGAEGRRNQATWDYDQATSYTPPAGGAGAVYHRPYDYFVGTGTTPVYQFAGQTVASSANFTKLSNTVNGGTTNFSSANVSLRQTMKKGITASVNYIWSNLLGNSGPIDNYNSSSCNNCFNGAFPDGRTGQGNKAEYGPLGGNTRHTFDGFFTYNLPNFSEWKKLTNGWQVSTLFKFYTGAPLTPTMGKDYSFTNESTSQRPDVIPGKSPYIAKTTITNPTGGRSYQVMANPSNSVFQYPCGYSFPCAITNQPSNCTTVTSLENNTTGCSNIYGNERPGQYLGTAFGDVDFSLFKYTHITEKINTEFRAEVFNLLNQSNLAGPGTSAFSTSSFGIITNTKNASGNPGLGYGEPFNVQFALKILF
jgi:hypothetical protein